MKTHTAIYCFLSSGMPVAFAVLGGVLPAVHAEDANISIPAYGLFETTFPVDLQNENPFDSSDISVGAEIHSDSGAMLTVPCFYDGEKTWKLRFTPTEIGTYSYRITAKNPTQSAEVGSGQFDVVPGPARGFVRIPKNSPRHFVFENGDSYFPLGENLGWVNPPTSNTWMEYLAECADAEINWIRIWMCPWGMTELEWTGGRYLGLGKYSLENARMLDNIFREAEQRNIYIQLVINHHGQYSIETNPVWDYNPYNIKNGGFLRKPNEFFTHQEALRHYRDRLRYLVARWGYSTHLLAWEFWNEVNLTSDFDLQTVKRWHEEMAAYLRSIDPYDHLMTTSSAGDFQLMSTIERLDYLQSHAYVTGLIDKVMDTSKRSAQEYPDRPHFFGEMSDDSRGPNKGDREGVILHNQLWASVHCWDSGTAMTWWWDSWVRPYKLYSHFKILSQYIKGVDWAKEKLIPLAARIVSSHENLGDLVFAPGLNWAKTARKEFTVRSDGVVENLGECSAFVHGQYHPEMGPNPIFLLTLDAPAHFGFRIQQVARAGATCTVILDEERVVRRVFGAAPNDYTPGDDGTISFEVPAGSHRISVRNTGLDWFQVQYYWIENYAQRPVAYIRGNNERILVWIHDRPHEYALLSQYSRYAQIHPTTLTMPEIQRGVFAVEQFDPYSGNVIPHPNVRATEAGLSIEIPSFQRDTAFRLRKIEAGVENWEESASKK